MTKLTLNLNPYLPSDHPRVEVDVGDFFLGYGAALENKEEEYKLPIAEMPTCMRCHGKLRQVYATSLGEGGLECKCSTWICPISPFSGSAYTQYGLKRQREFTKDEIIERAMQDAGKKTNGN